MFIETQFEKNSGCKLFTNPNDFWNLLYYLLCKQPQQ